jgi:hypothetical protein
MTERRLRQFHRRRTMWKCDRAESGIANWRVVEVDHCLLAERPCVVDAEFHEEVVRMLSIYDGSAVCSLAALE